MTAGKVLLVGCVKLKQPGVHPAWSLYRSPLWRARREYAEACGVPWFVLSALYGLIEPEQRIESYDLSLREVPAAERRAWGERVVTALESRLGSLAGVVVEVHAGAFYRRAVDRPLRIRGANLAAPTASIRGLGAQLAWYRANHPAGRRRMASHEEVELALDDLDRQPAVLTASEWPGALTGLDSPGSLLVVG